MGEIPTTVQIRFRDSDGTFEFTAYICEDCHREFLLDSILEDKDVFCPYCGSNKNVIMEIDLT